MVRDIRISDMIRHTVPNPQDLMSMKLRLHVGDRLRRISLEILIKIMYSSAGIVLKALFAAVIH